MILFLFFFFLCCLFTRLNNEVVVCCVCVVFFVARLNVFCLHLVVLLPFSCFFELLFFVFHSSPKKNPKEKTDTAKIPHKMQKQTDIFQLARLCSRIVFLFVGSGLKNVVWCWKRYRNSGFGIVWERERMAQKCQKGRVKAWSKVESKLGPSMLRNIIGPRFDSK